MGNLGNGMSEEANSVDNHGNSEIRVFGLRATEFHSANLDLL
jgi:hypothetical protein